MNILITGASGFIGSRLVKKLKKLKIFKIYLVSSKKRRNFIKLDLLNPNYNQIKKLKIDVCIHLAWAKIPDYSKQNSFQNYQASKKLFNFLLSHGCKKIISVGSCWEYKEDYGRKNEKNKKFSENIFGYYKKKLSYYGLKKAEKYDATFTWFRIFYVYGDTKKGLLKALDFNYKNKKKLFLAEPFKINDFIYVDDVVRCIKKSILMNNSGIFNLGSGKKTTTLEFCEEYCRLNKIRSSNLIEYKSRKTRKGIWASMSKTRKKFLFKKTIKLNLGIKKALEEFF